MPFNPSTPATYADLGFLRPEWFGAWVADANFDNGGTDNAATLQACITEAVSRGLPVVVGPGAYGIGATIDLTGLVGFVLEGTGGSVWGPVDTAHGTWFVWQGPAAGTLFSVQGMNYELADFGVACARSSSLSRAFDIRKPAAPSTLISTGHLFENVFVDGFAGPITDGWVCGEDNSANGEFFRFHGCRTNALGHAGIYCPNNTRQAKNWRIFDCSFGSSPYGINFNSGSADIYHCNFDALTTCAIPWFGAANEPITITGCSAESCPRMVQATGVSWLTIAGNRWSALTAANPQVVGSEFIGGGGNVILAANTFEEDPSLTSFIRPANSGTIVASGMQFLSTQPFSGDGLTTWRGHFANVRFASGNNLYPDGATYQRFVPNLTHAGYGLLFDSGVYPPALTYSGGTPSLGAGTASLAFDALAGNLVLTLPGGVTKVLAFVPPF